MHTGAAFGFTSALLRLIEKEKPDYLAVAFDSPEPTFRHEAWKPYKATREKMPDEMADQLPYIRRIVEAMRIPFLAMPGFEADDIIGTLVRLAEYEGIESFIVSGDKDFLQLVTGKISLYTLKKGGEVEIQGVETPPKKWGIPPERVVDLFSLMGDSSDNIPGVPGVGPVTAAKLVAKFGSIDDLYRRIDEVTPETLRRKLIDHREQAELCRKLVTIDTAVPLKVDMDELKPSTFDRPRLAELFEELEFESLMQSIPGGSAEPVPIEGSYALIDTAEKLADLVEVLSHAPLIAVDTETTSLDKRQAGIVGISFSIEANSAYFVPLHTQTLCRETALSTLRSVLEDPNRPKGGQNVKFDRAVLQNEGVELRGVVFDTMIESYLLDPGTRRHNLAALALKHLGIDKVPIESLLGDGDARLSLADVDIRRLSDYACRDADLTLRLHERFRPEIRALELEPLYRDVEVPLIEVLGDMERTGIRLDLDKLKKLSDDVTERIDDLTLGIHEAAGESFNINSPRQLGPLLYEKLRIQESVGQKRVKKTKTGYATDQETLEGYSRHPIVRLLLEYRNLAKLKSTYTDALPSLVSPLTGKLHTSFNQTVTATGRLSSSEPNLQNIPIRTDLGREIRKAFVPSEEGWKIISADYSQVELRILAHLSRDDGLIETFRRNEDIHRRTAALIFGVKEELVDADLRSRAKAINFGVIYGMGPQRLARETGISQNEAKDFIEAYFRTYAWVKAYFDRQVTSARSLGYVTTLLNRRRAIPDIKSGNPRIAANAERIAINTPIQGSAADLIKVAMVRIARRLREGGYAARMLLTVHDELVFEAPPGEIPKVSAMITAEMEGALELAVPLTVDVGVGGTWAEAH